MSRPPKTEMIKDFIEEVKSYIPSLIGGLASLKERPDRSEVLDNQLMQKVLPKLRGDDRIQETLSDLQDLLSDKLGAGSRAVGKLAWMIAELDTFGSTQFWR